MKALLLTGLLITNMAIAADGLSIMKQVDKANQGFKGEKSTMVLTLTNAKGSSVQRELSAQIHEDVKAGNKSLVEFHRPLDVKGVKLLTWSNVGSANSQWLYLPKFKRVKKINGAGAGGSFMGSEFSYEDIGGMTLDKYKYKLLKEEKFSGEDVWVIEATPKNKSSYKRQETWISKKFNAAMQVKYYDKKNKLLKVSTVAGFKPIKVGGKSFYRPDSITMKNKQNKKSSALTWKNRKVGQSISPSTFRSTTLKR